jgi:hypothetical protein
VENHPLFCFWKITEVAVERVEQNEEKVEKEEML